MKVFVAEEREQSYISSTDYHWSHNNELLMFGQFQLGNGNPSEVSMCGIGSRKLTTHIIIKDLNISKEYYKELITGSVELAMDCIVDNEGNYEIDMGGVHKFNINIIICDLLKQASKFYDGEKVKCFGLELTSIN